MRNPKTTRTMLAAALLCCVACSSIHNTPGSRPPGNSFCDQLDFGAGSVWVCASSPALLDQQRQIAARAKAGKVPQ